jgi:FixJ family two-component response regulator
MVFGQDLLHDAYQPIVIIVDDDSLVREGVAALLRSVGLQTKQFASISELLKWKLPETPSCLVLDVRLPGLSGLDFQSELNRANIHIPIVFMTGHADVPMSVRAMKGGAFDFLSKPFRDQDMVDTVQAAIEHDRKRRGSSDNSQHLKSAFESLTEREREVMGLVSDGLINREIATKIGVTEVTVKFHRTNMMRKMGAKSLVELVRIADTLGVRRGISK